MKNKVHEPLSIKHHQKEQNKLVFLSLGNVAAPQLVYSVKTSFTTQSPPSSQAREESVGLMGSINFVYPELPKHCLKK